MKISTRINGRVTSIKVKDSILALHFLITGEKDLESHVLDACYDIMTKWTGTTGKGASAFVMDRMLEDMLPPEDIPELHHCIQKLEALEKPWLPKTQKR